MRVRAAGVVYSSLLAFSMGVAAQEASVALPESINRARNAALNYLVGAYGAVYDVLDDRCGLSREEFVGGLELNGGHLARNWLAGPSCAPLASWRYRFEGGVLMAPHEGDSDRDATAGPLRGGSTFGLDRGALEDMRALIRACARTRAANVAWEARAGEIEGLRLRPDRSLIWRSACRRAWTGQRLYRVGVALDSARFEGTCAIAERKNALEVEAVVRVTNGSPYTMDGWAYYLQLLNGSGEVVDQLNGHGALDMDGGIAAGKSFTERIIQRSYLMPSADLQCRVWAVAFVLDADPEIPKRFRDDLGGNPQPVRGASESERPK